MVRPARPSGRAGLSPGSGAGNRQRAGRRDGVGSAKLIDVYPPSLWYPQGYALNLTDSIARVRYRNGRERGEPATPGVPVQVTITLYPTSTLFMPGHRIRLAVSSANFPRFDVNPNTGEAIGRERRRVVADNTVFHELGRESRAVLPIVPGEVPTARQAAVT